MTFATNIYPKIPSKEVVKVDRETAKRFEDGISITLYDNAGITVGGFNEGQPRLMHDFDHYYPEPSVPNAKKLIMPPIWALAHLYLDNPEARSLMNGTEISTSSAREFQKDLVFIGHSIKPKQKYDDYLRNPEGNFAIHNYGLLLALDKKQYPEKDMPFTDFLDRHRSVAKAMLLMDDDQIEKLKESLPKYEYKSAEPLLNGVSFCDGRSTGIKPLIFGGHLDGDEKYFGITSAQRIPVHSYPISLGAHNEIARTYTPEQFLAVSQAFGEMKKSPGNKSIAELERILFSQ